MPGHGDVVDVTSSFAALTLVGPLAREVFARFCAIDLRSGAHPARRLAPRLDRPPAGHLICEAEDRSAAVRLGDGRVRVDGRRRRRHHLGGGPIGVDALAEHPESVDA